MNVIEVDPWINHDHFNVVRGEIEGTVESTGNQTRDIIDYGKPGAFVGS